MRRWNERKGSRQTNEGVRIDYVLVSRNMLHQVRPCLHVWVTVCALSVYNLLGCPACLRCCNQFISGCNQLTKHVVEPEWVFSPVLVPIRLPLPSHAVRCPAGGCG